MVTALKRVPWIDLLAAGAAAAMVLLVPSDPLLLFRLFFIVWLLGHVLVMLQRFWEDMVEIREFLRNVEKAAPAAEGFAATGNRVFLWSLARVAGLLLRVGWPTLLLALLVVAANTVTWLVLAGWKPVLLKGLLW